MKIIFGEKDTLKVHMDLKKTNIRPYLWSIPGEKPRSLTLPQTSYRKRMRYLWMSCDNWKLQLIMLVNCQKKFTWKGASKDWNPMTTMSLCNKSCSFVYAQSCQKEVRMCIIPSWIFKPSIHHKWLNYERIRPAPCACSKKSFRRHFLTWWLTCWCTWLKIRYL